MAVGPNFVSERFGSGAPRITMTAGTAIVAGRLVEFTGDRTVGAAGATSIKVVGVATSDCDAVAATGNKVAIATGGVWNCRASGAIAAGDLLVAGAAGVVVTLPVVAGAWAAADLTNTRAVIGVALQAIANGQDGPVLLKLGA